MKKGQLNVDTNEKNFTVGNFRILSTFIIICYHMSCGIHELGASYFLPFYYNRNGAWGAMMVTTFFVLSGCTLHYSYKEFNCSEQVVIFYKKKELKK